MSDKHPQALLAAPHLVPRMPSKSPHITRLATAGTSPLLLSLAAAAWLVLLDNFGFWRTFMAARPGTAFQQIAAGMGVALVLVLLFGAALRPLLSHRLGAAVVALLMIASGGIAHYVDGWGVLIDKNMVRNAIETDTREVRELVSWSALADLTIRGLVPALFLLLIRTRRSGIWGASKQTVGLAVAGLAVAALLLTTSYGTLATTFRNHRELRLQLVPSNYINAVLGHFKGATSAPVTLTKVAPDAKLVPSPASRPRVLVLLVGETARAANFSLGGYGRDTNRDLAQSGITYFPRVTSCGTDTATSLPCMFSNIGADTFSVSQAQARENALDVLQRTGVQVTWLENNSGCKGVCARVPTRAPAPTPDSASLCSESGCHDGILVQSLKDELHATDTDALVVLHMMGSHGPSYFKRYPAPGRFTPTCDTNRIQQCSREALVNTYDNSIDYTSTVIRQVVDVARNNADRLDIAVIYVSDHGESLGENNIYLHGLPPSLAPREQKEVPMLGWLSPPAAKALKLAEGCLSAISQAQYSHDNLFHTLIGFHGVSTTAYKPDLDLIARARAAPGCSQAAN